MSQYVSSCISCNPCTACTNVQSMTSNNINNIESFTFNSYFNNQNFSENFSSYIPETNNSYKNITDNLYLSTSIDMLADGYNPDNHYNDGFLMSDFSSATNKYNLDSIICDTTSSCSNPAQDMFDIGKRYFTDSFKSFSNYFVDENDSLDLAHKNHGVLFSSFIKPNTPVGEFINEFEQIDEYIHDIFRKVTGKKFPSNIEVNVLKEKDFFQTHSMFRGDKSANVLGFSINRNKENGLNQVFIKESSLAEVLVVAGHEIGHVLSKSLNNIHDEEAKAFAFQHAWVESIIEYDFGELSSVLVMPSPANNGIHDLASDFVFRTITSGQRAISVFKSLVFGSITVRNMFG